MQKDIVAAINTVRGALLQLERNASGEENAVSEKQKQLAELQDSISAAHAELKDLDQNTNRLALTAQLERERLAQKYSKLREELKAQLAGEQAAHAGRLQSLRDELLKSTEENQKLQKFEHERLAELAREREELEAAVAKLREIVKNIKV